jgi:serine/threonine protein kinase
MGNIVLTFSQVFKAKNKQSGEFVALKKLYLKKDDKGKEKNRDGVSIDLFYFLFDFIPFEIQRY